MAVPLPQPPSSPLGVNQPPRIAPWALPPQHPAQRGRQRRARARWLLAERLCPHEHPSRPAPASGTSLEPSWLRPTELASSHWHFLGSRPTHRSGSGRGAGAAAGSAHPCAPRGQSGAGLGLVRLLRGQEHGRALDWSGGLRRRGEKWQLLRGAEGNNAPVCSSSINPIKGGEAGRDPCPERGKTSRMEMKPLKS